MHRGQLKHMKITMQIHLVVIFRSERTLDSLVCGSVIVEKILHVTFEKRLESRNQSPSMPGKGSKPVLSPLTGCLWQLGLRMTLNGELHLRAYCGEGAGLGICAEVDKWGRSKDRIRSRERHLKHREHRQTVLLVSAWQTS